MLLKLPLLTLVAIAGALIYRRHHHDPVASPVVLSLVLVFGGIAAMSILCGE